MANFTITGLAGGSLVPILWLLGISRFSGYQRLVGMLMPRDISWYNEISANYPQITIHSVGDIIFFESWMSKLMTRGVCTTTCLRWTAISYQKGKNWAPTKPI